MSATEPSPSTIGTAGASSNGVSRIEHGFELIIFASRWIQAPLYGGLIIAECLYAYKFLTELYEMMRDLRELTETIFMLGILSLIDITMVANLLTMVVIGGYATFVSKLDLETHRDKPEWLSHVNASVLKIKLAMAIIGISSISLLRTFIEAGNLGTTRSNFTETGVMWQVLIHLTFIISAIGIAWVDRLSESAHRKENGHA